MWTLKCEVLIRESISSMQSNSLSKSQIKCACLLFTLYIRPRQATSARNNVPRGNFWPILRRCRIKLINSEATLLKGG